MSGMRQTLDCRYFNKKKKATNTFFRNFSFPSILNISTISTMDIKFNHKLPDTNSRIQKVFYTTQNLKDENYTEIVNETSSDQDKKSKIKTNEGENNIVLSKLGKKIKIFFSYNDILSMKLFKQRIIKSIKPGINYILLTKTRYKVNQ